MPESTGYKSIALDLAHRIAGGELPERSKISGRSLLASQYHVSPETIRKAIGLLKNESIVSVSQGKEIIVVSAQNAVSYIARNHYLETVYSLKQDLQLLMVKKKEIDNQFETLLTDIINASDRLQNLKPYNPVDIRIGERSRAVGKTIAGLQLWQHTGATVVALRRGVEVSISPGPHVVLRVYDVLVVVGDWQVQERTERFINPAEAGNN